MDAKEEAVSAYSSGSNGDVPTPVVVRRTRSKRRRGVGQSTLAASDSSSASVVESGVTDEEEDMANCLILLAQGSGGGTKCVSRRVAEGEATAGGRAGLCVYECKTCNKCFPSFQALGGHRASHKKLEMAASSAEGKQGTVEESGVQISMNSVLSKHPVFAGGKAKVHVCSMCGSEFSSGQALGGHMRRHRPQAAMVEIANAGEKKERSVLSLDLNLPAPGDDSGSPFSIALVSALFQPAAAAPALVGCHY